MNKTAYRAVQIDLARQIETVDTVKAYFDTAAAAGMNMVVLYLEDRIRTATYPYPSEAESYSPEQIRDFVAYAGERGLELVPVVSPIGHAERFLAHEELKPLAELRGNIAGRFNEAGEVRRYIDTCPRRPETAAFMDAYITEVAALFPSRFFHIGFDEIFNMGFCDQCRQVVKEQGLPVLFRDSLLHYYHLLKGLGKTVMIWDDMLEQCDSVVDDLPKDIVLCAWFYRFYQRFPEARFTTSRRYDLFKKMERWGFSYFACTNIQIKSIDTLTAYARKYRPLGMLMTNWELSTQVNAIAELSVAYAGLLWNDGERPCYETLVKAARRFTENEQYAEAVATAATYSFVNRYGIPLPGADNMELNKYEALCQESTAALLEHQLEGAFETESNMVKCFVCSVKKTRLTYLLRGVAYELLEYRTGETTPDLEECRRRLADARHRCEELVTMNHELWEACRPGIPSPAMDSFLGRFGDAVERLEKQLQTAASEQIGRLDVHFCLPEYTSACRTTVWLHYADGSRHEVARGTYKSMYERDVYYDWCFEIPVDRVPTAITLEVNGHGASGFCYADVTLPGVGRLIPSGVAACYGHVEHPEYLLTDDFTAAVCGDPEMCRTFLQPEISRLTHGVTLSLTAE